MKTIGVVAVAAFAATAAGVVKGGDHRDLALNQVGYHGWQSIVLTFGPTVFDRHILAHRQIRLRSGLGESAL